MSASGKRQLAGNSPNDAPPFRKFPGGRSVFHVEKH
jgi:hypothetical protein